MTTSNKFTELQNFYTGKRVFLTGHTGFKGSWLCLMLKELGAEVYGYSLAPNTEPDLFTILAWKTTSTAPSVTSATSHHWRKPTQMPIPT